MKLLSLLRKLTQRKTKSPRINLASLRDAPKGKSVTITQEELRRK